MRVANLSCSTLELFDTAVAREHIVSSREALAKAIKLVTKADIRGWCKHCGYSLSRK